MIALSILKNEEDAYDATQEVFLKVFRYIKNFREESSFYTWLYRITYNVSVDLHRKRKNAQQSEYMDQIKYNQPDSTLSHRVATPHAQTENTELGKQIQLGLSKLSEEHRTILVLREMEGYSYTEIAEIMKISKGTVMSRLYHARLNLKKYLKEYV